MNITEYKTFENELHFFHGKASIKDGFYIENADEPFYHVVGHKSGFPIPELLHPEDAPAFLEAYEKMDEGPQYLIVRFLTELDEYHYMYMVMYYNDVILQGYRSFNIEITDIMVITDRYKLCMDQTDKYRKMMSLHDGIFFEYIYKDDTLQIYEYFNSQSRRLYYQNLTEAMRSVQENPRFTDKQKDEFISLGEMIHKRIDFFRTTLDAEVLIEYMQGVRLECNCTVIYKDDMHYKLVGLVHYVGEQKPQKTYYMSESAKDAATGLLNKRAINEYALERIQNSKQGGYLVLIDIDDFKQINDKYGHMFGDEVSAKCAAIFQSAITTRGMAGRFGGDEFMLVLENLATEEDVRRIMKVINKHAQWAFVDKEGFNVTFSCGISRFPEDGTTYEELFKKADKSLYIAKDKGKNRYIIYREHLHGSVDEKTDSGRSVGLKATMSDADKYQLLTQMVLRLYQERKNAIPGVMKDMQTYFDIDGIAIYTGADMHRTYSRGNYVNPIENMTCVFEPGYLEMFDNSGSYTESNIPRLEKKLPLAYEMNLKQESAKFMQYLLMKGDAPAVVVSFDFFNRAPKFGTTDVGMMQTIGKLLAEIVGEEL